MMTDVMQVAAAQISSSVRPAVCVFRRLTSVMVTMTAETTRMKSTVDMVIYGFVYFRLYIVKFVQVS